MTNLQLHLNLLWNRQRKSGSDRQTSFGYFFGWGQWLIGGLHDIDYVWILPVESTHANTFHEVKAKAWQSCAAAVICTGITVLISLDGIPSEDG